MHVSLSVLSPSLYLHSLVLFICIFLYIFYLYTCKDKLSLLPDFQPPIYWTEKYCQTVSPRTFKRCTNKIEFPFKLWLHIYLIISTYTQFGIVVPTQNTYGHKHAQHYYANMFWLLYGHAHLYINRHTYLWSTHRGGVCMTLHKMTVCGVFTFTT